MANPQPLLLVRMAMTTQMHFHPTHQKRSTFTT